MKTLKTMILVVGVALLFAACSTVEPVSQTAQKLNGPDVNLGIGSETSVAVAPGGPAGPTTVVVSWNESSHALNFPGQIAQWSVSNNGGGAWVGRSELNNPWVTTAQAPIMSDGTKYSSTGSNAGMAWTGWPGQFAMVTAATSVGSFHPPFFASMDVVLGISIDGGMNFGPAAGTGGTIFVVSDHNSSGAAGSNRSADRAIIYMEAPATHVGWVAWANPDINGCGTQNWIRRVHFNANGTVNMGPVTEVRIDCNLNCVWFDASNIAAYCDIAHSGTDNCTGGTETELITFPRVNNGITGGCWVGGNTILFVNQYSCTAPALDVQWKAAISQNPAGAAPTSWKQGVGGADGSAQMNEDPVWPQCAVPSAWGQPPHVNNRSRPVMIHDDVTGQWHVYYTKETFNALPPTTRSGMRVFHSMFNDTFTNIATNVEEVDPVTTIGGVGCGGAPFECLVDQFVPMGAWSPTGSPTTHVISWYDTRRNASAPKGTVWAAFSKSAGLLGTFTTNLEIAQAGSLAPWTFSGTNGNTPWGDYNSMASDGAGTFFPAYGDNRTGGVETQVTARPFQP